MIFGVPASYTVTMVVGRSLSCVRLGRLNDLENFYEQFSPKVVYPSYARSGKRRSTPLVSASGMAEVEPLQIGGT